MAWARAADPEGWERAMTVLMEAMVDVGVLEHEGVDAHGRIVYTSNVYEGSRAEGEG
jgi:hypothetical protein